MGLRVDVVILCVCVCRSPRKVWSVSVYVCVCVVPVEKVDSVVGAKRGPIINSEGIA